MGIETGVILGMQDNLSPTARKVAGELDNITKSADGINSAFDPKYLDDYNKKLATIGDSYTKLNSKINQQNNNTMRQAQTMISGVGTGVVSAGRGDLGGAALSGGKGISGLASSIFGSAGGLAAGALLAGGVAGNALANQYSQRAGPAQKIAALQDKLTTDMNGNTDALRAAMAETVASVTKFGKTYEEGANATLTFLQAGGTDFAGGRAAEYSQAYGADFGALSAFSGKTQRFGQDKGLDVTRALMRKQGLGSAQFGEVMNGLGDTFSQALSQGIIKTLPEIAQSQEFFSRAGATFQGGLGSQRLQGMNQTVANASGLQSESDIFLYRAAQGLEKEGDILGIKKRMEKGMTPEMFSGLMKEFDKFGYGKTESILEMSKMFGMSVTASEQMYNLKGQKGLSQAELSSGMYEGTGKTRESEYLRVVESIKQVIAGVGGGKAFDFRAGIFGGGEKAVDWFNNKLNPSPDSELEVKEIIANGITATELRIGKVSTDDLSFGIYAPLVENAGKKSGYSTLKDKIDEAKDAGVSSDAIYQDLINPFKKATSSARGYEGGANITSVELAPMITLLESLIEATNATTAAVLEPMEVEDFTPHPGVNRGTE